MNPFYDAHETSLSSLSEHEWSIVRHRWARGIDWNVHKVGRKWEIGGPLGRSFPLFRTKAAAYDVGSALVCAESRWRAHQQWEAEHAAA